MAAFKWSFFAGAAVIAAIILLRAGAPVETIAAGTGLAGIAGYLKSRR